MTRKVAKSATSTHDGTIRQPRTKAQRHRAGFCMPSDILPVRGGILRNMKKYTFAIGAGVLVLSLGSVAYANHAWGGYHWARTSNPLTLQLGNGVKTSAWLAALNTASSDWSVSPVLDTTVVASTVNPKTCKATSGRVEVCNSKYGNNGWLGIAQIWISGGEHITQGIVKLNDTYFNTPQYNTSAWRALVMCQEIGHTFGLNHQDEAFNNANLGTCMDYTSDPGTNQHPNEHDYDQLAAIYTHLDSINTAKSATAASSARDVEVSERAEWGQEVRRDSRGNSSLYRRNLANGDAVYTFVTWAE